MKNKLKSVIVGIVVCFCVVDLFFLYSCQKTKTITKHTEKELVVNYKDSIQYVYRESFTNSEIDTMTYVPTPEVAIEIAKAIAEEFYSEEKMKFVMPFEVTLIDGIQWKVHGNVCWGKPSEKRTKKGEFAITIDKSSGRINRVIRYVN